MCFVHSLSLRFSSWSASLTSRVRSVSIPKENGLSSEVRKLLQPFALVMLAVVPASAMSAEFEGGSRPESQNLRWHTSVIRIAVSTSLTLQNPGIKADADVLGALNRSI